MVLLKAPSLTIILFQTALAPIHTVTFETNGYGGEDFEKKVAGGFTVNEPAEPTDLNVNFGGWYKDSSLTTEWDFANDKVTSDITIYAKWTAFEQVATPVIAPTNGTTFEDTLNVTITCATDGADIYYTTDGTAPTTASTKYTSSIAITESKTIKAIAVKRGMTDSEVATASYTRMVVTTVTTVPPYTGTYPIIITTAITTTTATTPPQQQLLLQQLLPLSPLHLPLKRMILQFHPRMKKKKISRKRKKHLTKTLKQV